MEATPLSRSPARGIAQQVSYAPLMRVAAGLVGVIVLVAAACSDGTSDESDVVLPFEDIAVGEVEIVTDPSGTAATLRVDTSIDAVCAVAFGPTEALGGLATDTDMQGGGHAQHSPLMRGLEPETTYLYRLQGVGEDGNLYRSDLMSFTTPAAGEAADPGPNAAVGASVVDVSSEFSAAFAASNAVDGDGATEWSSAGDGDDAYVVIDLGTEIEIVGVGFRTRTMSDGSSTAETFSVTVDGETFGPFPAGVGLATAEVRTAGQTVRFDVETSTGGNTGAVEVEVYAAP